MNLSRSTYQKQAAPGAGKNAFTLIELLVVIAIISMLAAMTVHIASNAAEKSKRTRVEGDKQKLISAIENYKAKYGFYPPDNASLAANPGDAFYPQFTATNTLYYELTGVSFDPVTQPLRYMLNDGSTITTNDLTPAVGRLGIANSAPSNSQEQHSVCFLNPAPAPNDFKNYLNSSIRGLVVSVPLNRDPADPTKQLPANFINFWHYDASSTNRHNMDTYDLWAVFSIGNKIETNGNWMQQ